jgi:hypothetical protein
MKMAGCDGADALTFAGSLPPRWGGAECAATTAESAIPPPIVGTILSIQETFVQGGFDVVTGDVERLAGRKPRALRELLAGAFSGG